MARCRVMYTDEASNLLVNWLSSKGYEYAQSKLSSDCAEYDVSINNTSIKVWFDAGKQLFGFDRLHGGVKTGSFEVISEQFDNYVEINTIIIPESKLIADTYERKLGIKSVFDTFVGKSETGYTVKFRDVANKVKGIRVKPSLDEEGVYQALYVEYTGDNSYSVIDEVVYILNKNTGAVSEYNTVFELKDLECEDAKWCDGVLVYDKDNLYLEFETDADGVVLVRGNNGLYYTLGIKLTSKTLNELINEVLNLECWEHIPLYEEISDNLTENDELIIEDKVYKIKSKGTSLLIKDNNRWVEVKDSFTLEGFIMSHSSAEGIVDVAEEFTSKGVSEEVHEDEKPTKPVSDTSQSTDDVQVKKLYKDGKLLYVRFVVDGNIYDIKPEDVEKFGLDCNRIKEKSEVFFRFGMEMTDEELALKKFAVSIKTDEKVKEIIASLFR